MLVYRRHLGAALWGYCWDQKVLCFSRPPAEQTLKLVMKSPHRTDVSPANRIIINKTSDPSWNTSLVRFQKGLERNN